MHCRNTQAIKFEECGVGSILKELLGVRSDLGGKDDDREASMQRLQTIYV